MGRAPQIDYLRIFGCKAYINVPKKKRTNKFESQSSEMTFVGYESNSKGYRLWDKNTRTIKTSTDVVFDESSFPNKPIACAPPTPNPKDQAPVQFPIPAPSSDDEEDENNNVSSTHSPSPPPKKFTRPSTPFASPLSSKGSTPAFTPPQSQEYTPTDGGEPRADSGYQNPINTPEDHENSGYQAFPQGLLRESRMVPPNLFDKPERFQPARENNLQSPFPSPIRAHQSLHPPRPTRIIPGPATRPIPGPPTRHSELTESALDTSEPERIRVLPELVPPTRSSSRSTRGQTSRYADYV